MTLRGPDPEVVVEPLVMHGDTKQYTTNLAYSMLLSEMMEKLRCVCVLPGI